MVSRPDVNVYRSATAVFGVTVSGIGIAMIAMALSRGGGPLSLGVVLGTLFLLLGLLRLYLLRKG